MPSGAEIDFSYSPDNDVWYVEEIKKEIPMTYGDIYGNGSQSVAIPVETVSPEAKALGWHSFVVSAALMAQRVPEIDNNDATAEAISKSINGQNGVGLHTSVSVISAPYEFTPHALGAGVDTDLPRLVATVTSKNIRHTDTAHTEDVLEDFQYATPGSEESKDTTKVSDEEWEVLQKLHDDTRALVIQHIIETF